MNFSKHFISAAILLILFLSSSAEARHGRFWYGPGFYGPRWQGGYWFHGTYLGRGGWWWVVGPNWYYYTEPLYPYPPPGAEPVYVAELPGAPAPPSASPAGTVTATPNSPAGSGTRQEKESASVKPKAFSYYCKTSKSYYPNVKECTDGWIATPVKPPN